MHYYIYQITNLINSKIYVGVHQTSNLDDGYMGSGIRITRSIQKHGIANFKKDILEFFENSELMYAREKEIVTEEFLLREDTYNLRRGGFGGFDHLNKSDADHIARAKRGYIASLGILDSDELSAKRVATKKLNKTGVYAEDYVSVFNYNRALQQLGNTPVARAKALITQKATFELIKHQQGNKNSQFGTMWITDGSSNKKIKKDVAIPEGWNKGRT
jgi:hypothetical protein